jgi:hypothetical protein
MQPPPHALLKNHSGADSGDVSSRTLGERELAQLLTEELCFEQQHGMLQQEEQQLQEQLKRHEQQAQLLRQQQQLLLMRQQSLQQRLVAEPERPRLPQLQIPHRGEWQVPAAVPGTLQQQQQQQYGGWQQQQQLAVAGAQAYAAPAAALPWLQQQQQQQQQCTLPGCGQVKPSLR